MSECDIYLIEIKSPLFLGIFRFVGLVGPVEFWWRVILGNCLDHPLNNKRG